MARFLLSFAVGLCCAGSAFADVLTCNFKTECFETEACTDTSYELEAVYTPKPLGPEGFVSKAKITDQAQTTTGLFAKRGKVRALVVGDVIGGQEAKTFIAEGGQARHVVMNAEDTYVITYHGHCEEAE